ncbi:heterokaryon incompatibility protein-domain-containing protein [Ilyonectria robusta]|uniref:heterokaryon incompatibility protein-domain-containing protein n=1 Tax=Ilyonectria robusta TaxID=1079257 RepID=UPI001E8D728C|nr:heterokaryon incompatibility protein-domain-containing protein [Ilyonectria robusta]KAH8706190.1 heterokaryon incompatibility protein-domain-containing protein [Ilyonectria robusta]
MPLCQRCSLLTIEELVENFVLFHPNLSALKASAENGCDFCSLCWSTLYKSTIHTQLDSLLRGESAWPEGEKWTPSIWLYGGHFIFNGSSGTYIDVSCGQPYVDGILSWGERGPDSNPLPSVRERLEVYELPGSPSKYRLRGRRSTTDQNPEFYIQMIQQWLNNCCTNHRRCDISPDYAMPTRIIDVGDSANGKPVRLVSTQGIRNKYVALSYCWGVIATDILTLTSNTYDSMMKGIVESQLATAHQEVISLTRTLGMQYVWIDALCIIQGDVADWERESRTMAQVYGNATLTVIAGRSADSRKSFVPNNLASSTRPRSCQLPIDASGNAGTLVVDLPRSVDVGPVYTRGWCFQERLSGRRCVIFGEEQLRFMCVTDSSFENGRHEPNKTRPLFLQPSTANTSSKDPQALKERTLREWYLAMEVFVTCSLSNPHDIFAAITALAQPAARILKSRYLAGIWECDLVRGLLWRPCYTFQAGSKGKIPVTRPKATRLTSGSGPVVRAPSWSWAAVEGPVAQDQWEPTRIKKHRDPAFKRVRPKTVDPDRWSDDTQCDVDALHMPVCELQLIGHVAEAEVLHDLVSTYSTPTKNWRQSRMPDEHGVLLAGKSNLCKTEDEPLGHVVAVGFFDVRAERAGVESVWVLPLVRDRGLILKRNADGKFSRIGWCYVQKDEWFTGQDEVEVCLC